MATIIKEDADVLAQNKGLADILMLIASYYKMNRDAHRANAFATASAHIAEYPDEITSGAQIRKSFKGIGDSIEAAIDEYLATGTIKRLHELEAKFADRKPVIDYFLSFYGIGPATAVKFYDEGFRTLEDLWFKAQLTDAQKMGIMWRNHINQRIPRDEMDLINTSIGSILDKYGIKWTIAGSYRRQEPSSGDIDLLIQDRPDLDMNGVIYLLHDILPATLAQGPTKFMGILHLSGQYFGHRIDIRLIKPESYLVALMYFTGSQRFNILMRQRANELHMTLNEYGLYYADGTLMPNITSEEDIFRALQVAYLSPQQRTKTIRALTYT